MSGGEEILYYKASTAPLPPGTALTGYQVDNGYMHMATRAYLNGLAHLETLLHADWIAATLAGAAVGRQVGRGLAIWVLEAIFEVVRAEEFSTRPSRPGAVMVFPSLAPAIAFATEYRNSYPVVMIYQCRLVEGITFCTDMDLVNPGLKVDGNLEAEVAALRQRARAYWAGAEPQQARWPEILVQGKVVAESLAGVFSGGQFTAV